MHFKVLPDVRAVHVYIFSSHTQKHTHTLSEELAVPGRAVSLQTCLCSSSHPVCTSVGSVVQCKCKTTHMYSFLYCAFVCAYQSSHLEGKHMLLSCSALLQMCDRSGKSIHFSALK